VYEDIVLFYNNFALSSSISFSFSRNGELELGSIRVVEAVCIVNEVIGFTELVVIIGDIVEEGDLSEFF